MEQKSFFQSCPSYCCAMKQTEEKHTHLFGFHSFVVWLSLWLLFGIVIIIFFCAVTYHKQVIDELIAGDSKELTNEAEPLPVILMWNEFFGTKYNLKALMDGCSYQCVTTNDRRKLRHAGAVLFHIRDLNVDDLPKKRSKKQLFTFFLHESPAYTGKELGKLPEDYFNVSFTYRLDSDFPLPYASFHRIDSSAADEQIWKPEDVERAIRRKTKSVLQFVSNCNTSSKREAYVAELSKHIEVTQIGRCTNSTCVPKSECETKAVERHRFYLAFENSVCKDYITEKLYARMRQLMVPVVLKGSVYENIIPDGSYIAADSFRSPEHLANYLKHLEKNPSIFRSYFDWTESFKKPFWSAGLCDLCKTLHENSDETRIIQNITSWWTVDAECEPNFGVDLLERSTRLSTAFALN